MLFALGLIILYVLFMWELIDRDLSKNKGDVVLAFSITCITFSLVLFGIDYLV